MPKITVSIQRSKIYSIAEGISVSISQHNGGVPSYEQLWASKDEARKLDIYYREAISDLERHLTEWLKASSGQFNLIEDSGDYTLTLTLSPHWPVNMQGLLANKIQDYLVHAVTAGWLNDFEGLTIKQDYQAVAVQDVTDIRGIIYLRAFNFKEEERGTDGSQKVEPDSLTPTERGDDAAKKVEPDSLTPTERGDDAAKKVEPDSLTPTERGTDGTQKEQPDSLTPTERGADSTQKNTPSSLTPTQRGTDGTQKEEPTSLTPTKRGADTDKELPALRPEAGFRRKDNAVKNTFKAKTCLPDNLRHRDNDVVNTEGDWTDWSGTGIAFRERMRHHHYHHPLPIAGCGANQMSRRVEQGRGFSPSFIERPMPPQNTNDCPMCRQEQHRPRHKDPRIPDFPTHPNYPPIQANGIGWSDDCMYDEEGSEHFING